jgi:bacterioferritin
VRSPAAVTGHPEIIELLNEVLTSELTAVNQYFAHAKLQDHWGYSRLASHSREESMEEMRHAESAIERILYLEGVPNLQRLGSVRIGETAPEQLLVGLLRDEEQHADWLETQLNLIETLGEANYLSQQLHS